MITLIENIAVLSDSELLKYSVDLARHENDIGLRIIACLRETEKRMLYCQLGLSSLWEFATQYLGLSNGNAQMKIDAMRLARDNKLAQEKIKTGELSLPNAAKVNSFFRQEKKAGNVYTPEQKSEVIESVLGLSQSKCERALLARAPDSVPAEKVRPITESKTELKIVIDADTMVILGRLKELLSNTMPHATYAQLFDYLAREKVKALEQKQTGSIDINKTRLKKVSSQIEMNSQSRKVRDEKIPVAEPNVTPPGGVVEESKLVTSFANRTSRTYISVYDRRWVMNRAKGQCEHVAQNGRRCTSRWRLELDHIVPIAVGGKNERSNFRIVCKAHNLFSAKVNIGNLVMGKYVSGLR